MSDLGSFVVATPRRSVCDNHARALHQNGLLRFLALGTRRGSAGVSLERTRLNPAIGLTDYVGTQLLSRFRGESFRFRLLPWFDSWVQKQLRPGDNIISSYGYCNACFQFVRSSGGKTFLDAGNSHIENFWQLISEEHKRWNCPYPPFSGYWYKRSREMLAGSVDYVLSPSTYVSKSFLERGYKAAQILKTVYPVDLTLFRPADTPRPPRRPLTIINSGSLSLRKGTPYLLEAFRIIRKAHPTARLLLVKLIQEDVRPVLARFRDLPVEWSPPMSQAGIAQRLREADVFVMPSLEEGLVRTALEAMASGLQVVLTPNCGANDFVQPGVNGSVVPIRSSQALASAILECQERAVKGPIRELDHIRHELAFETFARNFISQLANT